MQIVRVKYKDNSLLSQISSKIKPIMKDYTISVLYLELFEFSFEYTFLKMFGLIWIFVWVTRLFGI